MHQMMLSMCALCECVQGGKAEGKEGKAKLAAAHATLEKAEARIAELQVRGDLQSMLLT